MIDLTHLDEDYNPDAAFLRHIFDVKDPNERKLPAFKVMPFIADE